MYLFCRDYCVNDSEELLSGDSKKAKLKNKNQKSVEEAEQTCFRRNPAST